MQFKFSILFIFQTLGAVISGFSGQYTSFIFAVTAYIADTTTDLSKLSLRLTRVEAISLLGGTAGQATSGLWIKHFGYAAPYWFMFTCNLTSLLYITFWLPESQQRFSKHTKTSCYTFKDLKLLAGVVINTREDRGRLRLSFLFISSALLLLPSAVINQLVVLYSKDIPLCWKAELIGYFLASLFFARAVGAVLCMKFLKWFHWKDYSIAQLGTISCMGLLVMIGLSTTTLDMFLCKYRILLTISLLDWTKPPFVFTLSNVNNFTLLLVKGKPLYGKWLMHIS